MRCLHYSSESHVKVGRATRCPELAKAYPLGGFDVEAAADISCLEVMLQSSGLLTDRPGE
jgi:hypothetical protein